MEPSVEDGCNLHAQNIYCGGKVNKTVARVGFEPTTKGL